MATVVGSGSAAATSVAIPAHAVGDLIIISARGTTAAPSVPAAGGTVPAWVTLQSGLANSIGLTTVAFVATATTTTSGAFTNATHICVIVLRAGTGNKLQTAAADSASGNGNNTQTIIYPALTLNSISGSSWGVRVGTRGVAVTAVGTAPTGWTNQVVQPAGASALMSLHTRSGLTSNPAADTVSTAGTNSAYRAHTIEVEEVPLVVAVSVGGVGSAGSFGAVTPKAKFTVAVGGVPAAAAFGGIPSRISVFGVPPPTSDLHVAGEYLAGQALVGWTGAAQFGSPDVHIVTAIPVSPGGVSSAQAFGAVTIRAVARPAAGGVSSSQAFGTPTIRTVARPAAGGVATAQAFGTPTIKTAISKPAGGVGSAQAFGTPVVLATQIKPVGGVSSAQSFGTPSLVGGPTTKAVGGVGSAQAFGTISLLGAGGISVVGVLSAQNFGAVTIRAAFIRSVSGLASAQSFGTPTTQATITKTVGAVSSAQAFGTIKANRLFIVVGLGSAQSFGGITLKLKIGTGGVPSAQLFGAPSMAQRQVVQVQGIQPVEADYHIVGEYLAGQAVVGWTSGSPRFGTVTIKATISRAVGGVGTAQAFGAPRLVQIVHPLGLGSAQAFGLVTPKAGPVTKLVLGVGSAQAFGDPDVFIVYIHPEPCDDLDLVLDPEADLVLAAGSCRDVTLVVGSARDLVLVPDIEHDLDLTEV